MREAVKITKHPHNFICHHLDKAQFQKPKPYINRQP
jgi:hypothetical protein